MKTESKNICDSTEHWIISNLKLVGKNISMFAGSNTRVEQMIEVNRCTRPGEECKGGALLGYPTWCHQMFGSYRVLVHDEEAKQHVERIFQYPSFCICKLGKVKNKSFK